MVKMKFRSLIQIYNGGRGGEVSEAKGSVGSDKESGCTHLTNGKSDLKEETSVSSKAPCSIFAYCKKRASLMKQIAVDEFLNEVHKGNTARQCVGFDAYLLSPSTHSSISGVKHTNAEISNPLSSCSSHNSISENAGDRATLTASDTSKNNHIYTNNDTSQTMEENFKASYCRDGQIFCDQLVKKKESVCVGDDMSCIFNTDCMSMMAVDTDKKDVSCSSASVNAIHGIGEVFNNQPNSCSLASGHSDEVNNFHHKRPNGFSKVSSKELVDKSDQSEISSLRDLLKTEPADCSEEQVESPYRKAATLRISGQINDDCNHAEAIKSNTETGQNDLEVLASEGIRCLGRKDQSEKSPELIGESDMGAPPLQCESVLIYDGSDAVADEVRVCDICGDAGQVHLLAICSKCSDGAEHTYCMQVKLEKVPEGNWMCEECVLGEKAEKDMQDKFMEEARALEEPSLTSIPTQVGNSSTSKYNGSLRVNTKHSCFTKIRTNRVAFTCPFSSKRLARSSEALTVKKRRAFETSVKSVGESRCCSKVKLPQHSSFTNFQKGKAVQLGGSCSNECMLTNSGNKTAELHAQTRPEQRSLVKSKSFNVGESKANIQCSEARDDNKKHFVQGTSIKGKSKDGAATIMHNSVSFNKSSGISKASDSKIRFCSSISPHVQDLSKPTRARGQMSVKINYAPELHNPLMSLPAPDSTGSRSKTDKEIAACSETVLPVLSKSSSSGPKANPGCGQFSKLSKPIDHLAHEVAKNGDPSTIVDDVGDNAVSTNDAAFSNKDQSSIINNAKQDFTPTKETETADEDQNKIVNDVKQHAPPSKGTALANEEWRKIVNDVKQRAVSIKETAVTCENQRKFVSDVKQHFVPIKKISFSNEEPCKIVKEVVLPPEKATVANENQSKFVNDVNQHSVTSEETAFSSEGQSKTVTDAKEHAKSANEAASTAEMKNSKATVSSEKRPCLRDLPCTGSRSAVPCIPQLDYLWQGRFLIERRGERPDCLEGIQAHLSTRASPNVIEAAIKLPRGILVEKAPRYTMWPVEFLRNHPTEDNIALYFFARDYGHQSNYQSLLDCMIKDDIGLKGSFGGIELYIFSSTVLPEKSQRWNDLLFLWGIFRLMGDNRSKCVPPAQNNPGFHVALPGKDLLVSVPSFAAPQNCFNSRKSSLSTFSVPYAAATMQNPIILRELPPATSGRIVERNERMSVGKQELLNVHGMTIDRESECQRMKNSMGGFDANYFCDTFPPGINGIAQGFPAERYKRAGDNDLSNFPADLVSANCSWGVESMQRQVPDGRWSASVVPDVELSLGLKGHLSTQREMKVCLPLIPVEDQSDVPDLELSLGLKRSSKRDRSSFLGIVDGRSDLAKRGRLVTNANNNYENVSVSLDLSLALPSPETNNSKATSDTNL